MCVIALRPCSRAPRAKHQSAIAEVPSTVSRAQREK